MQNLGLTNSYSLTAAKKEPGKLAPGASLSGRVRRGKFRASLSFFLGYQRLLITNQGDELVRATSFSRTKL